MPKIEKALIAFAIAALIAAIASRIAIAYHVLPPHVVLKVFYLVIISQVILLGYYISHSTSLIYRILFVAFIIGWVGTLLRLRLFYQPEWQILYSFKYFAELTLGILMVIKLKLFFNKDGFQLYSFLLALLLILPALYSLGLVFHLMPGDQENLSDALYIPLSGVIFTVMSNNNLWADYTKQERYAITYVLIVITLPVAEYILENYIQI